MQWTQDSDAEFDQYSFICAILFLKQSVSIDINNIYLICAYLFKIEKLEIVFLIFSVDLHVHVWMYEFLYCALPVYTCVHYVCLWPKMMLKQKITGRVKCKNC